LKESVQKTTKDMNKIIKIVTIVMQTTEEIGKIVNPTIEKSVGTFLRLVEPTITERYVTTQNNAKMGGSKRREWKKSIKIFKSKKRNKNKKLARKRKHTVRRKP
jgi:hypothetical protein